MIETIRPKCFYWMLLDIRLNMGNIVGILAVHKVDFRVRQVGGVSFFSNFFYKTEFSGPVSLQAQNSRKIGLSERQGTAP